MLTLQESVPTSTGKFQWFLGSSLVSMSMEPVSKTHNSWLSTLLMFCCFERGGIVSLPFSSVMPWWHDSLFLLNEEILGGSLVLTSSSLPTLFKCLGKLEGRLLRLGLEHSLDGLLHRTRAIGGACCFLLKALFPHPIPSYTALESSYSWGCFLTCSLKIQQDFVENFCWTRLKKLPSFWCSKHRV